MLMLLRKSSRSGCRRMRDAAQDGMPRLPVKCLRLASNGRHRMLLARLSLSLRLYSLPWGRRSSHKMSVRSFGRGRIQQNKPRKPRLGRLHAIWGHTRLSDTRPAGWRAVEVRPSPLQAAEGVNHGKPELTRRRPTLPKRGWLRLHVSGKFGRRQAGCPQGGHIFGFWSRSLDGAREEHVEKALVCTWGVGLPTRDKDRGGEAATEGPDCCRVSPRRASVR